MLATTHTFSPSLILRRLGLDQTVFGADACSALPAKLRELSASRVLLVRDPVATDACNISQTLREILTIEVPCGQFDITATISPADVDQYGSACAERGYDCIVAVGGGATMDAAKLIALRASNSRPLDELLSGGFSPNHIPLVAVPTTAGSGSEATHFAVLFVGQEKFSVAHPSLRPKWAIVDPTLTRTSPPSVAAAAGLDVLCQAIESLWSVEADEKSIAYASEALRLAVPNLHKAVVERDPDAQARLALASHLAGQAINRSFTTVCHALSYMLTARYNIPHGFATAATLPAAVLFNASNIVSPLPSSNGNGNGHLPRWIDALRQVMDCPDVDSAASSLVRLIRGVGGAASVGELQLSPDYQPIEHAESVNRHRLKNNPREVAIDDAVSLLLANFDVDGRELH